ncbi:DUF6616 family protein [Pseudomonas oryzihabitans]|uniref:Uncharacterized protein n=1 Tax=Pseudomonas oryzihabitans TaxID=47885 RepID=A0AAJ2BKH9_9PSED|nr:DUF6616 family protein [Pseudomonas psychrotolerans]MDR6234257.1 hypothetical protein [Pseudomonas psychrotolerans]MDR6356628.1 hypothetical protein [Pseudomonas psychrotolerans]MDR6677042.1 hypothetical protein [Pseudomonas psychrotolerans]
MSHYLVELYSPKPTWRNLSVEARRAFLGDIQQALGGLVQQGVELLSLGPTEPTTERASPHRFLGLWRCPDQPTLAALLAGIAASGWYSYFEHVNASGAAGNFPQHLADLLVE